ncbi:MAG: HEPN domain-containing protein [Candidatus Firestonebacteria bacterium]
MDRLIERLQKEGRLRKIPAGFMQVEALLREAILDLQEARKTFKIAERATYIMAYNAMLKAGRALLLLNGWAPDDGAQHRTIVEMTGAFLGEKYSHIANKFESMRRKRNDMTYEAGVLISGKEKAQAFEDAIILVEGCLETAKKKNPQMKNRFQALN